MLKPIVFFLFFGLSIVASAQNKQENFKKQLVEYFQKQNWNGVTITSDSLYLSPFKENFNVSVSKNFIEFDTTHIVVKNPYFANKYEKSEDDEDYVKNYPKSFSVIYKNSLVSLFQNGKFTCFHLNSFERNTKLEKSLNTKRFKYHWIIDKQLSALSGKSIYKWNGSKWVKYKDYFPLRNQPKLFEDDEYIVHRDCIGEWGGTVYFYDKKTSKTFFTESTCANSIIKDKNGYNVLAHLGHDMGSTEIKTIANPRNLTLAEPSKIGKIVNGGALGYVDQSNAYKKKNDFYGVEVFSSFKHQNKELFIVHLSDLTFLAEIKDNEIEIVNPLFFSDLYTHNPTTQQYGNYILINLDHYGIGLYREISVLIIKGNKILKVDWNKNHN